METIVLITGFVLMAVGSLVVGWALAAAPINLGLVGLLAFLAVLLGSILVDYPT